MSYAHPFRPSEELKKPLMVSGVTHLFIVAALLFSPPPQRGDAWGGAGAGGAIQVSLVGDVPGVPLPRPATLTDNTVATQSPGLFREEPTPKAAVREAVPELSSAVPAFETARRQRSSIPPPPRRSSTQEPTVKPTGAIPYGEGGPPTMRYTSFTAKGGQGGSSFGPGGSFSGKYSAYVEGVQRRVSSNWLISAVDPYVRFAPRVTVAFDIVRDGSIVSIQIIRSSGTPSVDRSAIRAIRESSPLRPLPSDYAGRKVSVEFFFDFKRP